MKPTLSELKIRVFERSDELAVIELWQRCNLTRPWNNPKKDILRKLQVQPDLFLVGFLEQELVSTIMAGYEGHRGWVNYLAVAPEHQRQGIGQTMMTAVEELLRESGCPKINIQVRSGNQEALEFYQALGYLPDEAICLGKRLEVDNPP
jgi:ribosomal protein S18 acetylase RimI-like enzyme